jgi:hypothetical protein
MGDDTILETIGKGNIKATMQVGGKLSHATITQVLHVPKMKNNFISMSKLISESFKVEFDKDGCKVNNARGVVVVEARRDKNLYLLNVKVCKDTAHITNSSDEGAILWHERLWPSQHGKPIGIGCHGGWHEFERSVIASHL